MGNVVGRLTITEAWSNLPASHGCRIPVEAWPFVADDDNSGAGEAEAVGEGKCYCLNIGVRATFDTFLPCNFVMDTGEKKICYQLISRRAWT